MQFVPCHVPGSDVGAISTENCFGQPDPSNSSAATEGPGTSFFASTSNASEAEEIATGLDGDELFLTYLWMRAVPLLFAVITIVGDFGNLLVIYVILSSSRMRKSITTVLLLNLAVADVLFLSFCVPFTAYKFYSEKWEFSNTTCQVVQFFVYVTAYVTIYTLVAISALRYVIIVRSHLTQLSYRANLCKVVGYIILSWIAIITLNIPKLFAHSVRNYESYRYCGVKPEAVQSLIFTFFALGYVIPLLIIAVLYLLIIRFLRSNKPATVDQQRARERTARACRVVLLVVLMFGIAWLPHHVNAIVAFYHGLPAARIYHVLRVVWYCMSYGNSCVNPIIYNYASDDFRSGFRRVIARCCCCFRGTDRCRNGKPNKTFFTSSQLYDDDNRRQTDKVRNGFEKCGGGKQTSMSTSKHHHRMHDNSDERLDGASKLIVANSLTATSCPAMV